MQSVLERYDASRKRVLPAGTVLFTEGETSGRLYIVMDGTVEIPRGSTQVAVVDEPLSFYGEMSALLGVPHTATVRALTPLTVYDFDDAEWFLQSHPEIALIVARMLAQRLNVATTYLVDIKRRFAGSGHLGMVEEVLASLHKGQPDVQFRDRDAFDSPVPPHAMPEP